MAFAGFEQREIVKGPLRVGTGHDGETCLVRLAGELDLSTISALEAELHRLMAEDLQTVVVDLEDLEFIDSTGLQCLYKVARRSRADGGRLRFIDARGQVDRLLRLTGIREELPIIS